MAETPILTAITQRATALVRSRETPSLVEVGRLQSAALSDAGVRGDLLPIQVPAEEAVFGPNYDKPIKFTTVKLAIIRLDSPDWLDVR